MKKTWSYFVNPFLVLGKKNFKKAVKISTYHDSALLAASGDPFYAAMYASYHPFHLALVAAYNTWKTAGGMQKGSTLTVGELLNTLSPLKINAWDAQVQVVLPKGSPDYVAVLPNGHQPFQEGEIDERINAVQQLGLALVPFAGLAATKADVDTFHGQLNTARNTQLGKKGDTEHFSDMLRDKITEAMVAMYANMGLCINNHPAEPVELEPLFDLDTVRSHYQSVFAGILSGNENKLLLERTFTALDEMRLQSKAGTKLGFYMSANAEDGPAGYTVIEVAANSKLIVNVTDFGPLTNRFLHVINTEVTKGEYKVQII